ncbi:hypothetical protein [Paracraurococcus lichenis]|uniref:Uncharacterized protein n=1 Tax=Paracraurococcus lichenis TaxID=3064888 RepID=A0ABT9DW69_9PROT|nr:hypothetical protein [Paracraurococcus sp. LOR1-02]MDO9708139.1 hypothetical protein [Paracraurococcus sp. LOR1-02]
MTRSMIAAAALALCAALPAAAQDFGGVRLRGPESVLDKVESFDRSGCRLSTTSVTLGVNKATANDSRARQQVATDGSGGCRPLVSTQAAVGVNLSIGRRASAEQSVEAVGPAGILATNTLARGVNIAAGARGAASQRVTAQTIR